MRIFFRFLAGPLPVGSVVGMQNFGRGRYPLPEIFGKNDVSLAILAQNANFGSM